MRHVSRTNRVALDWLFDRMNLDPKIQIRHIDIKHQLADLLTKGNFTRNEWNNLLQLFNINHFSSLCCAQNFSFISCTKTMAKRMQEQKEEERIVAKSKPTSMNLTSTVSTSSSSVNHPLASKRPGILKASAGKPDARARRNSKLDAASSSQGRLKDAYLGGLMVEVAGKPAATDESQELWEFSESESCSNHEKEVTGKLVESINSEISVTSKAGSRKWPHHFHVSPAVEPHMEKVYSIVRQIYGGSPTDDLDDIDVNNAIWCIFMNVTLQAAVHLGRDFVQNLRFTKNHILKSVNQLFQVTERLIKDQTEINGLTTIDYEHPSWRSTTPQCDKAI